MISNPSSNSVANGIVRRPTVRRKLIIRPPSFSWARLFTDLRKFASYGNLLYTLSIHRIRVRYKQSLLGVAWAIIQPLSMMLIFTVIFSLIARLPSEGLPYALFVYVALLPWSYFSTAVTNSTNGLVSHSNLITKVYFPREILPLSYVAAALFDFMIASTILVCLLLYYRVSLTVNLGYVVPILAVLTFFTIGVSLLLSAIQIRFRDIGIAVPLVLQVWLFATPIAYPLSAVPAQYRAAYLLNPMAGIIENFRQVVLRGSPPVWPALAASAAFSLILLILAYAYFKRLEATMADII